jgi:hypothetical protein
MRNVDLRAELSEQLRDRKNGVGLYCRCRRTTAGPSMVSIQEPQELEQRLMQSSCLSERPHAVCIKLQAEDV